MKILNCVIEGGGEKKGTGKKEGSNYKESSKGIGEESKKNSPQASEKNAAADWGGVEREHKA